ncbi:MAG: large conductance mechanosensitive channel protein MscL [Pirellulaceae bacterium]
MSLIKDFKDFALKGNVVDMAVGVVIGGAFGKIVTSFVSNIVTPPLSLITAKYGLNFDQLALKVQTEAPNLGEDGKPIMGADGTPEMAMQAYPILKYGPLITTVIDFLLIAIAVFLAIKLMNRVKEQFEKEKEEEAAAAPPEDVALLREIRDALNK